MSDDEIKNPNRREPSERIRWHGLRCFSNGGLRDFRCVIEAFMSANLATSCEGDPGGYIAMQRKWGPIIDGIVADGIRNCIHQNGRKAGRLKADPRDIFNEIKQAVITNGYYHVNMDAPEHCPINEVVMRLLSYLHAISINNRLTMAEGFPKDPVDVNIKCVASLVNYLREGSLMLRDPDPALSVAELKARNARVAHVIVEQSARTIPLCVLRNDTLASKAFDMQFSDSRVIDALFPRVLCTVSYCDPSLGVATNPDLQEKNLPIHDGIARGVDAHSMAGGDSLPPLQIMRADCELCGGDIGPESLKFIMGERRYELIRWDILYHLVQIVCRASALPYDLFQVPPSKGAGMSGPKRAQVSGGGDTIADRQYPSARDRFDASRAGEILDPYNVQEARILRLHQVVGHKRLLPILRIKEGNKIRFVPCKPSCEAIRLAESHGISLLKGLEIVDLETGASLRLFGPEEVDKILNVGETIDDLAKEPCVLIRYETYVDEHERGDASVGEVVGIRAHTNASVKTV